MRSTALKAFFILERDTCNQMFTSVRHQYPHLNADDFRWFLSECLDPMLHPFDEHSHHVTFPMAYAGFRFGLEVVSLNWLKDEEKKRLILASSQTFFPKYQSLLVNDPYRLLTLTSNLLVNLMHFGERKPQAWLDLMSRIASDIETIAHFKDAGVICAWLVGLAHYRDLAIGLLEASPTQLLAKLLNVTNHDDVAGVLHQIKHHRWFHLDKRDVTVKEGAIQEQQRLGQCDLVGGEFTVPPTVTVEDHHIIVSSGERYWRLYADAYGATLIPNEYSGKPDTLKQTDDGRFDRYLSQPFLKDLTTLSSVAERDDMVVFASDDTFALIIARRADAGVSGHRSDHERP